MSNFETLQDLLVEQLQDIFDAESQLVLLMPRMVAVAKSEALREALVDHNEQTSEHLARLREIFGKLDIKSERKPCKAMKGLIEEAEDVLAATGDPRVVDAALIAAAQRIEHYEIASYVCVRAFADIEGHDEVVSILDETIKEENNAEKLLVKIAEGGLFSKSVNKEASKV